MAKLYLSNGSTFKLLKIDLENINTNLFPPEDHPHVKADITDFAHTHTKSDITDFAHTHSISDITDTIIGKSMVQPSTTFDFLSYDVPAGIYSFAGGDSTKKAPFKDGQILSLPYRIGAGGRYGAQMAFEDDCLDVRIRTHHRVNGWSEWSKFAMVSDIPTTYDWAKVNNRPTTISDYGITDAYTKTEVNNKIASVYRHAGTTTTYSALATVAANPKLGDVWNIEDTGMNYVWNGTAWDPLGSFVDLTPYVKTVKVGSTSYNPSSGVISLPAYPTIPTALKNPYTLTIQRNSTTLGTYDGSSAKIINIIDNDLDTKNTAGATNTTSKIFLVGATTQAASPQTYTQANAYTIAGAVYSEGKKTVVTDDTRLTNSRPASDVHPWAKASTKPSYNLSEIAETTTYKSVTQEDKARWNAKSTLELGETSATAYRGDKGEIAYNHSQVAHAPSNAQKNSDITKAEIEAKLTGTITTHNHDSKYAAKATTLSGYGITNAYTIGETTNLIDGVYGDLHTLSDAVSSKADLVKGKIPANQLPSFVDDVLEYNNADVFPATGESGKIYIALDSNKTYRWSGSKYVVISETLALGETSSTAYSGSKGKANALAISNINTALAGKLGTGDKAYDSARLGGTLASQYVLASTLSTDYATKNYVTNSFAPISSVTKIINGTTQVGNTKKVDGKEVKYYTKIAFASITPVAGVHYIVYEN